MSERVILLTMIQLINFIMLISKSQFFLNLEGSLVEHQSYYKNKMIYFSSHKFAFSNLRFSPFYEHFRQLRGKYVFKLKNKVHHVN